MPKIRIEKNGRLLIERAGEMREAICPYCDRLLYCNADCAQFYEPFLTHDDKVHVEICHDHHWRVAPEDFVDER